MGTTPGTCQFTKHPRGWEALCISTCLRETDPARTVLLEYVMVLEAGAQPRSPVRYITSINQLY